MSTACFSLSQAAYLAPDLVLPLVHQRFEVLPPPAAWLHHCMLGMESASRMPCFISAKFT